jgi:glycine C-acetyltransferase
MEFSRALFDEGRDGDGHRVSDGAGGQGAHSAMLTSEHTKAQLDQALETLERVAKADGDR